MKTTTFPVKTYANYALILISSFALSYSLATYFIFGKPVQAILVIAAAAVFGKSMWFAQNVKSNN